MEKKPLQTEAHFQPIFNTYKNHHSTEGFELKSIFELYLPFWRCEQQIIVEEEMKVDRFSSILLQLLTHKINSHREICAFLGVSKDSFVNMQLHFLIKNNFIRELADDHYEITYEGQLFLENKSQAKQTEKRLFQYHFSDLAQSFFDPAIPIDAELSTGKKSEFSGYKIEEMDKIHPINNYREIPHDNKLKPTLCRVSQQRNEFTVFFNSQFKAQNFYDFVQENNFTPHKRCICFLGFLYESPTKEQIVDVRQCKKSVTKFDNKHQLEKTLTEKVRNYLQANPEFL